MITFKKQTLLLSACATLFLGACSGEHDSLGTGHLLQEANSDLSQKPEQQKALTPSGDFARYTGSLREAELVKSNILSFIDLLYPTSALDDAPFTQTSDRMSGEVSGLLKHQKAIVQAVLAQLSDSSESGPDAAVYDFKHCTYQGSARQSDTTNLASGMTKNSTNLTFSDCQDYKNITLNGEIAISTFSSGSDDKGTQKLTNNKSANALEQTLSFSSITLIDAGKTFIYSGNISLRDQQKVQITESNLHRIDTENNTQHYFKDLVWVDGEIDQLSGRIYNSGNGYIELSASENLALDYDGIPRLGELRLDGKYNSRLSISKAKDNNYGSAHIGLDEYGDGFYEHQMSKNVVYTSKAVAYAAR